MTDRAKDEAQNYLFIQLWQEQIVINISHRFYHLIQLVDNWHELAKFLQIPTLRSIRNVNKFCTCATATKHTNMLKKCITCHSCQITMKAAHFSLRLLKNSVHFRKILTTIWSVGGLTTVHLTTWSQDLYSVGARCEQRLLEWYWEEKTGASGAKHIPIATLSNRKLNTDSPRIEPGLPWWQASE
jgi:hypothetical protein